MQIASRSLDTPRKKSISWQDWSLQNAASLSFIAWIFIPELRRLSDWHSSFHNISLISLIPIAILLPALFAVKKAYSQFGLTLQITTNLWLIAFGYGLFISIMSGGFFAAIYEVTMTFLPLGMFVYLLWRGQPLMEVYQRLAETMLWAVLAASLYGIYQYIAPPPWDIAWLENTGITSMGTPEPFGLRIFGTTSSTGQMAQIVVFTILLNLPRFSVLRWKYYFALIPMLMALLLTLSRTCWIQLAVGILVYLVFAPRRREFLATVGLCTTLAIGVGGYLATRTEAASTGLSSITDRVSSLGSLSGDDSYVTRQEILRSGLENALSNPLGEGLGVVGVAAKLGATGSSVDFDNGFLARYYELGFIGFAFMMLGLGFPLYQTLHSYFNYSKNRELQTFCATALAIQIALLLGQLAEDVYFSITGMFFWISLGMVSAVTQETKSARKNQLEGTAR